jgi:hypothetical protein
MYIWLIDHTFYSGDWRFEVVCSFIDSLDLMNGDWYNLSSFDIMIYFVVGFVFYWSLLLVCLLSNSFESLPILHKSSNWFIITYPFHPYNDPFHHNLGLLLLTSQMILFHKVSVLRCLLGQEAYSQVFSTHYLSVWLGFGSCDYWTTPRI